MANVSLPTPPMFEHENYDFWSVKMKALLVAYDLWNVIKGATIHLQLEKIQLWNK